MSEMAKKARRDMRAKINRITSTPAGRVDASGWEPPEPLHAGRKVYDKSKERSATAKVYKLGGKIQGDRGPRARGKKARGGYVDGGVPSARFNETPVSDSKFMNKGGKACAARTGNKSGDGYFEGTRPTGGRIARAEGGRTRKGKTNIVINIGKDAGHPPMSMPPVQMPTRPPMPPMPSAGPPPGGPPPGMPPGGPGAPGGPPMPPPSMVRKHGGRTLKSGVDVHMTAGAGGGLGRLEKAKRYGAHQH